MAVQGAPFEVTTALVCALLYLSGYWTVPSWAGILILGLHYAFWYWAPSTNPSLPNYAGPIGPTLGFCSAIAWASYVRLRQAQANRRAV